MSYEEEDTCVCEGPGDKRSIVDTQKVTYYRGKRDLL